MKKIKETYLLFLIVIGLISLSLYTTYALFTASTTLNNVVGFNATLTTDSNFLEYEMITVEPGNTKIIELNITNSYGQSLYYGAWYEIIAPLDTSNISLGIYADKSANSSSGQIASGDTKLLIIGIRNNGTEDAVVNIGTVGSLTSNLNLPSNRTLLPTGWKPFVPDIELASYTVNGTPSETFPTIGTYTVTPNCTNATVSYDYTEKKFKISNISSTNATCNPALITIQRTTFANHIKNLLGTNTSVSSTSDNDGSTLEKITENGEDDYRYRGINPNNYVMFNNELWRIIGVFDDNTHGIENTHLVKIIRNDSIGGYVWENSGTNGRNNFPNSDIYNILNTAYYNHINATGEDYCYSYQTSLTGKCDFRKIGIQTEYQSMVESGVNWFLGGNSSASSRTTMYQKERSTTTTTKDAGLTVPVGLMYASDYGYAAPSTCTSTLSSYNTDGCANKNWLKSNFYEWTITYNSSYATFFTVDYNGTLNHYFATDGFATRPTLYLKSSVYYLSGSGTQTDPYIIAM